MSPRAFFNSFVLPAVADWQQDRLDARLATVALCQLDILLERCMLHEFGAATQISSRRDALAAQFPFLGLARDVQHGALHRRTAKITRAQTAQTYTRGGGIGGGVGYPIGGGITYLVIETDDGEQHDLGSTIAQCEAHLSGELSRLGL